MSEVSEHNPNKSIGPTVSGSSRLVFASMLICFWLLMVMLPVGP